METLAVYVFATVFQLPFHLLLASPWLVVAALAVYFTRRWDALPRIILTSGLAAIGLAPAYGFHASMMPVYMILLSGLAKPADAVLRILLTWLVLAAPIIWYQRRSARSPNSLT